MNKSEAVTVNKMKGTKKMIIKFENKYKEIITFEVEVKKNDTFIQEKQEEMFKRMLQNSSYKVIEA